MVGAMQLVNNTTANPSIDNKNSTASSCCRGFHVRVGDPSVRALIAPVLPPVPGGGNWGSWNHWSLCSKTCDSGWQRRFRLCEGTGLQGYPCDGSGEEVRSCNEKKCPGQWFLPFFPVFSDKRARFHTASAQYLSRRPKAAHNVALLVLGQLSLLRSPVVCTSSLLLPPQILSPLTLFSCLLFPWLYFSFFLCLYSSSSTEGSAAL